MTRKRYWLNNALLAVGIVLLLLVAGYMIGRDLAQRGAPAAQCPATVVNVYGGCCSEQPKAERKGAAKPQARAKLAPKAAEPAPCVPQRSLPDYVPGPIVPEPKLEPEFSPEPEPTPNGYLPNPNGYLPNPRSSATVPDSGQANLLAGIVVLGLWGGRRWL